MIRPERRLVKLKTESEFQYRTKDGLLWDTLAEAVEHEERLNTKENPVARAVYEGISTIQEAINKAVATGKVVRYLSSLPNAELKRTIDDIKGCKLMKPSRDSNDIAIIPPGINNFDFNDIDTSIVWNSKEGSIV